MEQQEKKDLFLKKAHRNLENQKLHRTLIKEKIESLNGLNQASVKHFLEKGKVSGALLLALMDYAESYHVIKKREELLNNLYKASSGLLKEFKIKNNEKI